MKLIIIRHGDPDYSIDNLTEKGVREAIALSDRIAPMEVRDYYVSTMGRARATASYTLEKAGRTATYCDWLREFQGVCIKPTDEKPEICWDWLPADWMNEPVFYDPQHWTEQERMKGTNVKEQYDYVLENFDELMKKYGYEYSGEGGIYHAVAPHNDTIVLFCHFGVGCVMIARMLGISPMILWHGFISAPTGVTTVISEERRPGIANFRVQSYGDVSHLLKVGEPVAFAGRFCEVYGNPGERC